MKVLLRVLPFAVGAVAHVQLLSPTTRNTVDRDLPQWKGGHFELQSSYLGWQKRTIQASTPPQTSSFRN